MQKSEDNKKQTDNDIMQCKADILRAAATPASSKETEKVQEKPKQSSKPAVKIIAVEPAGKQQAKPKQVVELRSVPAKIKPANVKPAPKEFRIPKFEEIIAKRNGGVKPEAKTQKEEPPVKVKEAEKPKDDDIEIVVIDEPEVVVAKDDAESKSVIPEFNLGEQILKEQRKVAAVRRKRPTVAPVRSVSIEKPGGTIGEVISETKKLVTPLPVRQVAVAVAKPVDRVVPVVNKAELVRERPEKVPDTFNSVDEMTNDQQRIIAGIVTADIMRMCGSAAGGGYAWQSFANN